MANTDLLRRPSVLLDADVLHRANVRDILLRIARRGLFRPRWSPLILAEVERSLQARRYTPEQSRRLNRAITAAFPDAEVAGFEPLIEAITLPDPGDRHVVAAALAGRSDLIVTFNLVHFPDAALAPHGLEAMHPDTFLMQMLAIDRDAVLVAVRALLADLKTPPIPLDRLISGWRAQGLAPFASEIEKARDLLAP